jgi:hypothetical protein
MVTHELKVLDKFYPALKDGRKPFEIRRDDRHYAVDDRIIFREIRMIDATQFDIPSDGETFDYTGNKCLRQVTYILSHEMWEVVPKGHVIMGLKEVL